MATAILYDLVTHSPEETVAFGRSLGTILQAPCAVLLEGDLGSGKTTLAKGIVAGLGASREDDVTSPSFTLVHEYGKATAGASEGARVYHVDLYRVEGRREIESFGLDELFSSCSTVIIEWGDKLPEKPPMSAFRVRLDALPDSNSDRRIVVQSLAKET